MDNYKKKDNYNIFICYRSKEIKSEEKKIVNKPSDNDDYTDGKYIALDIYSELQKYEECNCFFAPKHYKPQDDFKLDIPKILKDVKVCLLILTKNFFKGCNTIDDIVKEELVQVLERNIIIIPIFAENYKIESERDIINEVFKEKDIQKFFHKSGVKYNSIYDFDCSELYESILNIMACNECNINANLIDDKMNISEIINSPSVTVAQNKIFNYLEKKLYESTNLNMKSLYEEMDLCIEKICNNVPHFSVLKIYWTDKLKKILKQEQTSASIALKELKKEQEQKKDKTSNFAHLVIKEHDGILVFSQSQYAIDFLSSVTISARIRNSSSIYICEGRSKCRKTFEDALSIYHKLEDARYGKRTIITDCSVDELIREGKINKIILGACSVKTKNDKLVSFINAAGTEILLMLADRYNIPVYVVSLLKKHIDEFRNKELQIAIKDLKSQNFIDVDCIDYVEMYRTPTLIFVNENGLDISKMVKYFQDDINKDKRELSNSEQEMFLKSCNTSELILEKQFLIDLNKHNCKVPKIYDNKNYSTKICLERIKGIRIFELFVILDELLFEGFLKDGTIKKSILDRCNKKQQVILNILGESIQRKNKVLEVYPIEKIKDLLLQLLDSIYIYYPNINCDISKKKLIKEADSLYGKFKQYAKVPFRDATIKNMALDFPELDGLDNIIDYASKNILKEKIKEILRQNETVLLEKEIIDFDFSSAHHLTTRYDDFIGLNMHERTYNQTIEDTIIKNYSYNEEFAISLFIRYLRFSGRKYLYRLMHPSFHSIRFKYDNEKFYFEKFIYLIDILYPKFNKEYSSIYALIKTLSGLPTLQHKFDMISYWEESKAKPWLGLYKN